MTILEKLNRTLDNASIEELKDAAIVWNNDLTNEGFVISLKINDMLMERLPDGEFAKFVNNELL